MCRTTVNFYVCYLFNILYLQLNCVIEFLFELNTWWSSSLHQSVLAVLV